MPRNTLRLDLSGFKELMTQLDELGGDLIKVTEDALTQAGETIGEDTRDAVQKTNLPAAGKYSQPDTEKAVVTHPQVEWTGMTASIGVGFDYSKSGAGGFLITGTPRMKPVAGLQEIHKRKKYMSNIQKEMSEIISDAIAERMEGK